MQQRKKASDFDPRILELYYGYVHGRMSKRQFLDHAAKYTLSGAAAAAVLDSLQPNYALAQQVPPDDPAIETEIIEYGSPDGTGTVKGLLARPAGADGPLPAVLIVHEYRGLNPYIEDDVRRLGKAGYLALGPDGLSSLGGYPGNDEEGREMQSSLDRAKLMEDFFAGYRYLADHPDATGRVGAVGFCYGGGVVNALAVAFPGLDAAVPFYGRQPEAADVPAIEAPLMLHYAGLDERVNAGWPAYEAALQEMARATRPSSTRAPSMASTTTRRPATTPTPPSSPGSGRWSSSTPSSGRRPERPHRRRFIRQIARFSAPAQLIQAR